MTARAAAGAGDRLRVLFSAHGLPETDRARRRSVPVADRADRRARAGGLGRGGRTRSICYQSRATPQRWIGPSTEAEIERAAHDGVAVLVVPIAFVSDHSETLVELDIDYRALADRLGVPGYFRVPTQNSDAAFITALADLVRRARAHGPGLCSHAGGRICPADRSLCPLSMTIGFLAVAVSVDQGVPCHRGDRLDGRACSICRGCYVYHCELRPGSAESERFKVMERRLLKQIINPAMIATWTFGVLLVLTPGIIALVRRLVAREARHGAADVRLPRRAVALAARLPGGPQHAAAALLPHRQRGARRC